MSLLLRKHIEEISPLSDEEFEFVLSHFQLKTFKKHQFLVQAGQPVHHDYWVEEGLVKSYSTGSTGKDHILQFGMENWWVTDYQAYFNLTVANFNVDCLEESRVWALSLENREKLCEEMQKMERFFRIRSNKGYVALQARILSLLSKSAEERYEELLGLYPSLIQRVPKTLLAAYLGVSRETLSRLTKV